MMLNPIPTNPNPEHNPSYKPTTHSTRRTTSSTTPKYSQRENVDVFDTDRFFEIGVSHSHPLHP
jgi:hypothetical protein